MLRPHGAATGFVRGRSIVDNARPHTGRGVVVNARQSEVDRDVLRAALDLFRVHHVPHQLLDVRGASAAPGLTTLEAPVLELALPVGGAGRPYELTTLFDLAAATRALTALVRM